MEHTLFRVWVAFDLSHRNIYSYRFHVFSLLHTIYTDIENYLLWALSMQRPTTGGSANLAVDRRRPNRGRGEAFSLAASSLFLEGPHAGLFFFLASRPCAAAMWVESLLVLWVFLTLITRAGDIESKSGLQTKFICPSCNKNITRTQGSIHCNITPTHWMLKMQRINIRQYTNTWKCNIHNAPAIAHRQKTKLFIAWINHSMHSEVIHHIQAHQATPQRAMIQRHHRAVNQQRTQKTWTFCNLT